jgi:hypothetical protein
MLSQDSYSTSRHYNSYDRYNTCSSVSVHPNIDLRHIWNLIGASRPKNLTRIFTGYWTDGISKKYVNPVVLAFNYIFEQWNLPKPDPCNKQNHVLTKSQIQNVHKFDKSKTYTCIKASTTGFTYFLLKPFVV